MLQEKRDIPISLNWHKSIRKKTSLAIIFLLCTCLDGDFNKAVNNICTENKSEVGNIISEKNTPFNITSIANANEKITTYADKLKPFVTSNGISIDFEKDGIGYGTIQIKLPDGTNLQPIEFVCDGNNISDMKVDKNIAYHLGLLIKWQHLSQEERNKEAEIINIIHNGMTLEKIIKSEEAELMKSLR